MTYKEREREQTRQMLRAGHFLFGLIIATIIVCSIVTIIQHIA